MCQRIPDVFSRLHQSLWILKIQTLHCLVIWIKLGWLAGIRVSLSKFREVQSSKNCVIIVSGGQSRILFSGKLVATVFRSSGKYLALMSEVALHRVSTCTKSSSGTLSTKRFVRNMQLVKKYELYKVMKYWIRQCFMSDDNA